MIVCDGDEDDHSLFCSNEDLLTDDQWDRLEGDDHSLYEELPTDDQWDKQDDDHSLYNKMLTDDQWDR